MLALKILVLAALAWCIVAMLFLLRAAKAFGSRKLFAPSSGDSSAGIRYAFTKGLSPGAKESVREHPLTWAAGLMYHAGILAAFVYVFLWIAKSLPAGIVLIGFQLVLSLGCVCGIGLLLKRIVLPHLRSLSTPDDYVSNGLTSTLVLLAFLHSFVPSLEVALLVTTACLFLYAPVGKIRHCLFFFLARFHFGAFFGRRNVFPPAPHRQKDRS